MTRILFICLENSCRARMAAAFVRARKEPNVEVFSCTESPSGVHPQSLSVMKEVGIDVSLEKVLKIDDIRTKLFDLVITLSRESFGNCPVFAGYPEKVQWNVEDPEVNKGSKGDVLSRFRETRDQISSLVKGLFEDGYLRALVEAKSCSDLIINNISDGIIAHDLERRIFFFNRSAEEITGYKKKDVMGKDCHDVFPGKFCGGKCHFCDGEVPVHDIMFQELTIATKSGEARDVVMSVKMMKDLDGHEKGVLVSFQDVTREHELAKRAGEVNSFAGIIGRDKKMLEMFDLIRDLANSDVPVLIHGDSGTGKELVAAAIHSEGIRGNKLFVPVNCGALPEALLESELFGHVKGAFTGAIRDKKGRFELADGGTIFLDEIGDIPPSMQVKLLRVLQEGTFERVGSEKTMKVDVRLISATNKNLSDELASGRFREDLYYRLSVVPVELPPLCQRRNDIPLLVEYILARELERSGKKGISVSHDALEIMMSYDWPGNIRELQNWIQFALVKCKGDVIEPVHLPPRRRGESSEEPVPKTRKRKLDLFSVRTAIQEAGGNKLEAAKVLGVSRATLYRFLDEMGEF